MGRMAADHAAVYQALRCAEEGRTRELLQILDQRDTAAARPD
jgi:hypothetical protein